MKYKYILYYNINIIKLVIYHINMFKYLNNIIYIYIYIYYRQKPNGQALSLGERSSQFNSNLSDIYY